MTIKELRLLLENYKDSAYDNKEVKVLTAEPRGIGPRPYTRVESVSFGFDWESGLLIKTEVPLVPKEKKK